MPSRRRISVSACGLSPRPRVGLAGTSRILRGGAERPRPATVITLTLCAITSWRSRAIRSRSATTAVRARSSRSLSSRAVRTSSAKVRWVRRCRAKAALESPSDDEEVDDAEVGVVVQDGELPPGASDEDRRAGEADRRGRDHVLSSVARSGGPERDCQRDPRDRPKEQSPVRGQGSASDSAANAAKATTGTRTGSGAARRSGKIPRSAAGTTTTSTLSLEQTRARLERRRPAAR